MTGWHLFRKESYQPRSVVVLAILALWGGSLSAAETSPVPGTTGHEFITLTNITPERGRELLGRLKIATASKLPGSNSLLVTAEPGELQKAVALLNVVDSRTEFDVRELGPAADRQISSNLQIAAAVGAVSIGTFAYPPKDKSKLRAIVDVHRGNIVVIAPVFQLPDIKLVLEQGPEALKQKRALARSAHGIALSQTVDTAAMPPSPFSPEISSGSMEAKAPQTESVELSTAGVNPPAEPATRNQTQEKPADGLKTEPKSLSQASPEPTAPANPQPTESKPVEVQVDAQPAQGQPTTGSRPEAAAPAQAGESATTQPTAPPAGQTGPAGSTPVAQTPSPTAPPTTPVAASSAAPQAQAVASPLRPVEAADGDTVLDLTLPEQMPVIYLLDLVGKHLGLSYVYNPDDVKGMVTLKLNGDLHGTVRVKDLYPLLEQSLRQLNLATTRHKGNVVAIVPVTRVMESDPPLIDRGFPGVQSGDTVVTCKFELKHIDTTAAKNLIEGMKLNLDPVAAIPEKRMLMVTSYAYRMEKIERLLQMIDQPGEPKKFRFKQLRYTMAKTLTDKVKSMAEQMLESVSVTVAEPEVTPSLARQPGETDIAYRTRVAAFRAQQTQQQAALRAQQVALRASGIGAEPKQSVYLDADERTNRVLMIGAEKQLAVVEELVIALDVQQQDLRALQLYRIQHVDAEDVAQKLLELNIISKLPDGSTASSRYATPGRITPQLPGQPRTPTVPATPEAQVSTTTEVTEKGLVEEPQVVVVEATNSLLVNATDEQHAKIAHIIEYVDSETLTDEIPYRIYPLENSSPKHLSEVLQSLIQETVEQQKEGGKIEKVVVNRDEKIRIVPDPNTYSLIVYGNKKNQEWISTLITQLDKRRPQVLIDVTLVEITNQDAFEYSLDLVHGTPSLVATAATGAPGLFPPGGTAIGKGVGASGGALSAFYGDKQIQVLLNAIQDKRYGRVLAKPKLLVNDNEKGKIDTKETTYVKVTSSVPYVAAPTAGTQVQPVTTAESFNSYDAGIMMDITPHISEGELLRLDVKLSKSSIDPTTKTGTRPPDKTSREVETVVTLPNASTVILGGMLDISQNKNAAKVPILGDIPILGGLFRSVNNSEKGTKIYMFVKAEIIRPDDTTAHGMKDLEILSARNREAFEKYEREFQAQQDWPGIKPKRLDPPKVLDAQ